MEYLTTEDLLALAADLDIGPIQDLGLLDSAAHRPRASVFGRDAYPDIDVKAGALLESIVVNHPLVDATSDWDGSRWSCSTVSTTSTF